MEKTIKRISVSDLNKLAIIFTEQDIKDYSMMESDKLNLDDMIKNDN